MIDGLTLVYHAAAPSFEPVAQPGVTVALEKQPSGWDTISNSPFVNRGSSSAAHSQVRLTVTLAGRLLASCDMPPPEGDVLYDEVLKSHFWNSGAGWFLVLPTEQATEAFKGLLHLWHLVDDLGGIKSPSRRPFLALQGLAAASGSSSSSGTALSLQPALLQALQPLQRSPSSQASPRSNAGGPGTIPSLGTMPSTASGGLSVPWPSLGQPTEPGMPMEASAPWGSPSHGGGGANHASASPPQGSSNRWDGLLPWGAPGSPGTAKAASSRQAPHQALQLPWPMAGGGGSQGTHTQQQQQGSGAVVEARSLSPLPSAGIMMQQLLLARQQKEREQSGEGAAAAMDGQQEETACSSGGAPPGRQESGSAQAVLDAMQD